MNAFAGTRTLTLLALRRDRNLVPAWILTFVAIVGLSGKATETLYTSVEQIRTTGIAWNASAALIALHGRIYDDSSLGAVALVKMTGLGTAMVGLLAVMLVIRHTRADEEVGRTELAAAGVVGRYAALTAALLVTLSTTFAIGLLSGLSLIAAGLPSGGSMAFGAAWAGAGLCFAGIGAVAAQLATSARTARGIGAGSIGAFYIVRAIGDTSADGGHRWVSWLSPIGWSQQMRPFSGDRWVAVVPMLLFSVILIGLAYRLLRERDLGAGLLADRPGPAVAPPALRSATSLVWRLDRFALAGWTIGMVVIGAILGSVASTVGDLLDNPDFADLIQTMGGTSVLEDAYLSTVMGFLAIAAASYGISASLRLRHEEAQGRAEQLLTSPVSRVGWASAHLVPAFLGTVVLMVAVGLSTGVAYAIAVGDPSQIGSVLLAAVVRLPAVWVFTAVVMALFGVASRLAALAWLVLTALVVIAEFGPLMNLPAWTKHLTPFDYTPSLPGGDVDVVSLAGLTLVAATLVMAGLELFRRRDLQPD